MIWYTYHFINYLCFTSRDLSRWNLQAPLWNCCSIIPTNTPKKMNSFNLKNDSFASDDGTFPLPKGAPYSQVNHPFIGTGGADFLDLSYCKITKAAGTLRSLAGFPRRRRWRFRWAAELSELPKPGKFRWTDPELFVRVVFFFSGEKIWGWHFNCWCFYFATELKHLFLWDPQMGTPRGFS